MCSVCGIASEEPDPENIRIAIEMLARTSHRGPDACGIHASGITLHAGDAESLARSLPAGRLRSQVVLAQSRLTITGSSAGKQPFTSEDGVLAFAHNGEAYNHDVLRSLVDDPSTVTSGSDSESLMRVLEHHYATTQGDLATAVRRTVGVASGMYAVAATDGERVVLARDAIGKKPMYYVQGARRFAWASERKALVEVARAEDAAIRRLRPGELLVYEPGLPARVETVEHLVTPAIDITDMETAVSEYEKALNRAIERRTRNLARAAVFFSGGVDSVMVARLLQRAGVDVTGYVCGTRGSGDVKYALEVAEEMKLPVKVTHVDEDTLEKWLPTILHAAELHGPMMAEVSVPMFFAAKAAHEDGHRVVFTGQAADELFAGYDWYRKVVGEQGHLTLHARLWEDVRALPVDCLEREDRISMAWSLEMRAPFLDADVIRVAMRITPQLKLESAEDTIGKRPHRILAARIGVPESVAYRLKVPAQDGANIHDLLEAVAKRRFTNGAPATDVPDFGSNYRYRDAKGKYGSVHVRALLDAVVREGGFVVAGEDASAHAPPLVSRRAEAE